MEINALITPDRVACQEELSSKKRVLERLGELLATSTPSLTDGEIFDSLINRERLGSTGLGKGVAIPHGRVEGLSEPLGALVQLRAGVDFDAIDGQPVDLLFGLLVPHESTEEHLQILASLAKMFSDSELCEQLRQSRDPDRLYRLLSNWEPHPVGA
jgi:PTS system nitrogen regulatory IIA component